MDCGCRVEVYQAPGAEDLDTEIIYCPKHLNVDKVVEALESIKTHCGRFMGGMFNVGGIYFLAQEALSTLHGEPDEPVIGKDGTQ